MNKFSILAIIAILIASCGKQNNKQITFSLESDACTNVVQLYRIEQGNTVLVDECDFQENEQYAFSDTCPKAFYMIQNGKNFTKAYAEEGQSIKLKLSNDTVEFIQISNENKALVDWRRLTSRARSLSVDYSNKGIAEIVKFTPFYESIRNLTEKRKTFLSEIKGEVNSYFYEAMEVSTEAEIIYYQLYNPQMPVIKGIIGELPDDLYGAITTPDRLADPLLLDAFEKAIEYTYMYAAWSQHKDHINGKRIPEYIKSDEIKVAYLLYFARLYKDGRGLKTIENGYSHLFTGGYALEQLNKVKEEFAIKADEARRLDIELKSIDQKIVKLSDYKGKVIVVDVWATWCVPCLKKRPSFEKLAKEMSGEDVVFIAISIDTSEIKWKKMAHEGSPIVELLDHKRMFSKAYSISTIPHFLIFDTDGSLLDSPAPSPGTGALKNKIKKALQNKK